MPAARRGRREEVHRERRPRRADGAGAGGATPAAQVERRFNLAGTQVCFDALRTGAIDLYAEYTGTGLRNILGDDGDARRRGGRATRGSARRSAQRFDLLWLAPFGFNNTYVLDDAAAIAPPRSA